MTSFLKEATYEPVSIRIKKELKTRHMTMISIAGVIGAGLFVGAVQ